MSYLLLFSLAASHIWDILKNLNLETYGTHTDLSHICTHTPPVLNHNPPPTQPLPHAIYPSLGGRYINFVILSYATGLCRVPLTRFHGNVSSNIRLRVYFGGLSLSTSATSQHRLSVTLEPNSGSTPGRRCIVSKVQSPEINIGENKSRERASGRL